MLLDKPWLREVSEQKTTTWKMAPNPSPHVMFDPRIGCSAQWEGCRGRQQRHVWCSCQQSGRKSARHISQNRSGFKCSIVNTFFVPRYLHNTAEFGSRSALVTMVIEVALGGGRRACFRRRQTEKERSVTVINVLAETETVHSRGPVDTLAWRGTPGPTTSAASQRRGGTGGGLIIITWIIYYTKIYYFFRVGGWKLE